MPAQPDESAAESIRNALQLFANVAGVSWTRLAPDDREGYWSFLPTADVHAIRARLEAALRKLDAPRYEDASHITGIPGTVLPSHAEYATQFAPLHYLYRDAHAPNEDRPVAGQPVDFAVPDERKEL